MVTILFRSRLRDANDPEYHRAAPRMLELAQSMPGFVSFKAFAADDGERLSIIEFDAVESADAWRRHSEHLEAQALGRSRFYSEYSVQVSEPFRDYEFNGKTRTNRMNSGVGPDEE